VWVWRKTTPAKCSNSKLLIRTMAQQGGANGLNYVAELGDPPLPTLRHPIPPVITDRAHAVGGCISPDPHGGEAGSHLTPAPGARRRCAR